MSLRGRRHGGGRKNELVFLTTCGPATTFDPKITGVAGTWFFDDGTTMAAASGVEISKTFTADGLHRAVFRPVVGGLAAVTAIDVNNDAVLRIANLSKCVNQTSFVIYGNANAVIGLGDLSRKLTSLNSQSDAKIYGDLSQLPNTLTSLIFNSNTILTGNLSALSGMSLTNLNLAYDTGITGALSSLPATLSTLCSLYGCTGITAASIAHLVAIRDLRIYSMGWLTADVDTVIDSMWAARANYTYATPAIQIGGTNEAPTGDVVAPEEGTDWHQDGATWIPLTTGAKAYDLAKDVNSEGFRKWTITYTGGSIAP